MWCRSLYDVLLETLQAICAREIAATAAAGQAAPALSIKVDRSMLSPKNAFVLVTKPSAGLSVAAAAPSGADPRTNPCTEQDSSGAGEALLPTVAAVAVS